MQGLKEETRILRGGQLWLEHRTPRPLELRVCAKGACWYSPRGLQSCPTALRSRTSAPTSPGGPSWRAPLRQPRPRGLPAQHSGLGPWLVRTWTWASPGCLPTMLRHPVFPGGAPLTPPGCSHFLRRWGYGNKSPFCDTRNASRQRGGSYTHLPRREGPALPSVSRQ